MRQHEFVESFPNSQFAMENGPFVEDLPLKIVILISILVLAYPRVSTKMMISSECSDVCLLRHEPPAVRFVTSQRNFHLYQSNGGTALDCYSNNGVL